MLVSITGMGLYDSRHKIIVMADAGQSGLEATMFQTQSDSTRRPVYYVSKSMIDPEQNYAVIEKEALSMA